MVQKPLCYLSLKELSPRYSGFTEKGDFRDSLTQSRLAASLHRVSFKRLLKYVKRSEYTDRSIDSVSDSDKCDKKNRIYRSEFFSSKPQDFNILPSHMSAGSKLLLRV